MSILPPTKSLINGNESKLATILMKLIETVKTWQHLAQSISAEILHISFDKKCYAKSSQTNKNRSYKITLNR